MPIDTPHVSQRDPRPDATLPLDGSWPWASDLGDDPEATPSGFSTLTEAQQAHDALSVLWESVSAPDQRAFLAWFREDGPEHWPFSRADIDELRSILEDMQR